ncbi:long-chain-fatty-acid--CoA ligase [Frankia sp. CcI49]|uniref:long-chain-fatty-acid--CoA ligase n=1 Tax=Frankia sp. CcI49 TaxID=1745382 RepID=UPI0009788875|nr:long-chain fatty acid--CoA ligase [Frankia sp. CcI49]ONH50281.1 long-chain-fatty-acid--CoA ligase [Frankia sp. CcI49]
MSFNLAGILRESAKARPGSLLCQINETPFTYSQVDEISGRIATSLLGLGLEPGDKVAVQLPNLPQFVFTYFAVLKAGLVLVPLNPLLKAPEVAYHLRDCDAKLLVTFEMFAAEARRGAVEAGGVPTYVVNLPDSTALPEGAKHYDELYFAEDGRDLHPTNADDTAVLIYTSGTTGQPKGAELTHFQLYMNCTITGELLGLHREDIHLAVLPLFHVFGLSSVLNCTVRHGAALVLVPRFEPEAVIDAIAKNRCTVFSGVPTMYAGLLSIDTTQRDLSCLRVGVAGGSSLPGHVIRSFEKKFQSCVILEGYGLSESASATTFNINAEQRKVLSVGKPIWGVEVRVVDEKGNELPSGPEHIGEIVIRGHNIMKGYYKRPEATAEALRDGWFHTGDLAYTDGDGYFYIADRKKDLVIRGGYNVYPREVEEVLYAHDAVVEAAVIGKPDDRLGEEILAFVACAEGVSVSADELIEFTKERLAAYKYPREIRFVAELPKGSTGKILKRELTP